MAGFGNFLFIEKVLIGCLKDDNKNPEGRPYGSDNLLRKWISPNVQNKRPKHFKKLDSNLSF